MMNSKQLRDDIIKPTLSALGLYAKNRENLLFGTAAHESKMGMYLKQIGGGPALGLYQMEPVTHRDCWNTFLVYRPLLSEKINKISGIEGIAPDALLVTNFMYATAMATVKYLRIIEKIPDADDLNGLAKYWKKYYNTVLGKGTPEQFIKDYLTYENS
jgi:hypothetical protein